MPDIPPRLFQAATIKAAIKLYLDTGVHANRAYTPKAMLATATTITGYQYPNSRIGLARAMRDLGQWIEDERACSPQEPKRTR